MLRCHRGAPDAPDAPGAPGAPGAGCIVRVTNDLLR